MLERAEKEKPAYNQVKFKMIRDSEKSGIFQTSLLW